MFVAAVCFMFSIKLKWPKSKNIYDLPSSLRKSRMAYRSLPTALTRLCFIVCLDRYVLMATGYLLLGVSPLMDKYS